MEILFEHGDIGGDLGKGSSGPVSLTERILAGEVQGWDGDRRVVLVYWRIPGL